MPKRRMKRHAVTQPSDPSYKIIPLTKGQNTLVDTADYDWLNQWYWHAHWNRTTQSFYVARGDYSSGAEKTIPMASFILNCKKGEVADHINHNTLDNRRSNLRKASYAQNNSHRRKWSLNTSGYRGVSWRVGRKKDSGKWRAFISYQGKRIWLGEFDSIKEAVRVRDEAAKKLHGEFAVLNLKQ